MRPQARGTFKIRNGQVSTTRIRKLGHGRYTLTVAVGHGRNARVLLHQSAVIH
ncbi:MAG: hypothetical protein ACTHMY_14940 [Solirubrobacteraceae bacterium]